MEIWKKLVKIIGALFALLVIVFVLLGTYNYDFSPIFVRSYVTCTRRDDPSLIGRFYNLV